MPPVDGALVVAALDSKDVRLRRRCKCKTLTHKKKRERETLALAWQFIEEK